MTYYVFNKDPMDITCFHDDCGLQCSKCLVRIPMNKTVESGKPFTVRYKVIYDAKTGKCDVEYYDDEDEGELPSVITDCSSCGYAAPMSDKLYVDKFTHPLVYCRHHEVICLATRSPCEWAMRGVKKSP